MKYRSFHTIPILYLLGGATALVLAGYFILNTDKVVGEKQGKSHCLTENQEAYYTVVSDARPGIITVSVRDKVSSTTIWTSEEVTIPNINNAYFYQAGECNFYVQQSSNFDYKKLKEKPGYSYEIWQLEYFSNIKRKIVLLEESLTGNLNDLERFYSTNFIVDPTEKYIVLIKNYLEDDDYSMVIREIDSGKEVYALYLRDVMKNYPSVFGSFRPETWKETSEGNYLHGTIFEGPRWSAFFTIKNDTWETEILPTPDNYRGGVERAGTIDGGYLAYTDQTVWTGIDVVYEAIIEKQLAEGKPKNLFVANLRTGEIRTIESVPLEEAHRFNLKWNGSTLSYTMPDGTVKSYTPPF